MANLKLKPSLFTPCPSDYILEGKCCWTYDQVVKSQFTPRGTQNLFLTGCAAQSLKPLPISKGFSTSNDSWFYYFLAIFANWDPWRVFNLNSYWLNDFFPFLLQMGSISKDLFLIKKCILHILHTMKSESLHNQYIAYNLKIYCQMKINTSLFWKLSTSVLLYSNTRTTV